MQEKTTQFTIHIKKESLKQRLHLRRNIDQGQTVANREGRMADGRQRRRNIDQGQIVAISEGAMADGRQRGRQEHFAQRRIDMEGVLDTKK